MNEDYKEVFDDVRAWQGEHNPPGATSVPEYWEGFFYWVYEGVAYEWLYGISKYGADPFIDALKQFFPVTTLAYDHIKGWLWDEEKKKVRPFGDLLTEIYNIPISFGKWIALYWYMIVDYIWKLMGDIWTWIKDKWEDILDYVWNLAGGIWKWVNAVWVEIADYLWQTLKVIWGWVKDFWEEILDYVWKLLGSIWNWVRETWTGWEPEAWKWILEKWSTIWAWVLERWEWIKGYFFEYWERVKAWVLEKWAKFRPWIGEMIAEYWPPVRDFLSEWLKRIWEGMLAAIGYNRDRYTALAAEEIGRGLGWVGEKFTYVIDEAYKEIWGLATKFVPMTPERAPQLAGLMFGAAVGFGALAHGIALSVEAIPNLKYMGVHYLSAFASRMGSFGMISSATMGVLAAVSVKAPFQYYMKSLLRPTQPRAGDLMMMAVKPDIPPEVFRRGMTYEGYSDYWIDRFNATMYNEPRYFELSMMGEDESATVDWLMLKARRSGYTVKDSEVFVSSLLKKVTRTQRQDYYKQAFNAFKEGYIDKTRFKTYLDDLDMRPEAQELSIAAAELAYHTDLQKDLIGAYRTAYRNDLITEEEFSGSLAALGITPERVDTMVYLEWVRKTPSALKAERREIEKAWREVQKKYTSVYIEAFRRGLITEDQLVSYLVAIGIKEEVAKATGRHEAIKKIPKPKIPEILPPAIPPPPTPPELEE